MDSLTRRLLGEAWCALSGEQTLPSPIEVTGGQDLLESVFPVIPLASAAMGAAMLAAARLAGRRAARPAPAVQLETGHVACAVRSERYARGDGQLHVGGFAPLSQFFQTADGWIRVHANYPWHRERLLRVLETQPEPDAVARAISGWPTLALEDAICSAGGCAAGVRTVEAWRTHPQGGAADTLPLLAVERVGEAPAGLPELAPGGSPPDGWLPASGLRVLDLTRVIAGPVCTRTLGALGADVLRIDSPDLPERAGQRIDTLAAKRSTFLDLRQPADRDRFETLLAGADVLVQGYRPGALGALGLSPAALLARRPGLVVVSLSAWGEIGPWAQRRGFDSLVQAASGIALAEAGGDPHPGVLPAQVLDHVTGYLAAGAALVALANRHTDGGGWQARVSLAQTAAWLLRQPLCPKPQVSDVDPTPYQRQFPSTAGPITLIDPPGRLDGRPLRWPGAPARYGGDSPSWAAR